MFKSFRRKYYFDDDKQGEKGAPQRLQSEPQWGYFRKACFQLRFLENTIANSKHDMYPNYGKNDL